MRVDPTDGRASTSRRPKLDRSPMKEDAVWLKASE